MHSTFKINPLSSTNIALIKQQFTTQFPFKANAYLTSFVVFISDYQSAE
jgi:hypothetical protein